MPLTTPSLIEEILDATSTGWWEYNSVENRIIVNSSWLKILGLSENQSIGIKQWLRLIHPDDRTQVFKNLNDLIYREDSFRIEWRMLNTRNEFVWFASRLKVVEKTESGKPLRTVGVVTLNIQEHARIETLEKEAIKKAQLINGLMQISFSSTSIYDFVNQKVINSQWRIMKRLGYGPEEFPVISDHFFEKILHPDDAWIIQKHMDKIKLSKNDEVLECVFRLKGKNENYHWVALRDTVLYRNKSGDVCQLIGSMIDVTRYKTIKKELDDNLAMLESLSYRNSHELRAPVATILGLIQVIRHELETEGSVQELIDLLEQTISKMDKVIHEFNRVLSK